jgi:hypothetical protein
MNGRFQMQGVKTGFWRKRQMQTGSSGTLIGWKSGQTTFVPLWDRMEGACMAMDSVLASLRFPYLQLQCRYEAIQVWSYTTFIV